MCVLWVAEIKCVCMYVRLLLMLNDFKTVKQQNDSNARYSLILPSSVSATAHPPLPAASSFHAHRDLCTCRISTDCHFPTFQDCLLVPSLHSLTTAWDMHVRICLVTSEIQLNCWRMCQQQSWSNSGVTNGERIGGGQLWLMNTRVWLFDKRAKSSQLIQTLVTALSALHSVSLSSPMLLTPPQKKLGGRSNNVPLTI